MTYQMMSRRLWVSGMNITATNNEQSTTALGSCMRVQTSTESPSATPKNISSIEEDEEEEDSNEQPPQSNNNEKSSEVATNKQQQKQKHSSHPMHKIKREEERKARILFVIILIFLACNTLRFILNFEECLAGRDYAAAALAGCTIHPFWALVMNHCSQLLICINSSLGFVVYCVMSQEFRKVLWERVNKYL